MVVKILEYSIRVRFSGWEWNNTCKPENYAEKLSIKKEEDLEIIWETRITFSALLCRGYTVRTGVRVSFVSYCRAALAPCDRIVLASELTYQDIAGQLPTQCDRIVRVTTMCEVGLTSQLLHYFLILIRTGLASYRSAVTRIR